MKTPDFRPGSSIAASEVTPAKMAAYLGRISSFLLDSAQSRLCGDNRQLHTKGRAGAFAQSLIRKANVDVRLARRLLEPNGQLLNRGYFNLAFVDTHDVLKVRKLNYMLAGAPRSDLEKARQRHEETYHTLHRHFGEMLLHTAYSIQPLYYGRKAYPTVCTEQPRVLQSVDIFSEVARPLLSTGTNTGLHEDIARFTEATQRSAADNVWPDLLGTNNIVATPVDGEWRLRLLDTEPYPEHWVGITWPDQRLSNTERLRHRLGSLAALLDTADKREDPEMPEFVAV